MEGLEPPRAPEKVSFIILIQVMSARQYRLYPEPEQVYWAHLMQELWFRQLAVQMLDREEK